MVLQAEVSLSPGNILYKKWSIQCFKNYSEYDLIYRIFKKDVNNDRFGIYCEVLMRLRHSLIVQKMHVNGKNGMAQIDRLPLPNTIDSEVFKEFSLFVDFFFFHLFSYHLKFNDILSVNALLPISPNIFVRRF